ncbi:MAG: hypothetical protein IJT97_02850 [Bacteroidaceae bacterium]|nr:hypothetical protein [Bacteroidaceae bacterium]
MTKSNKKKQEERGPKTVEAPSRGAGLSVWPVLYVLAIIGVSAYYLIVQNSDVLYMAQSRQLWYGSEVYWNDLMKLPGGLLAWTGSYLTQFLYKPALGSGMLIALWVMFYFLIKGAFQLKGWLWGVAFASAMCLLAGEIDLGYWIYYIKIPGYYFRETLGFMAMAGLFWIGRLPRNKWVSIAVNVLIGLTYPLFGAFSLLALLLLSVKALKNLKTNKVSSLYTLGSAIALLVIVPIVFYQFYPELPMYDAWVVSFPMFRAEEMLSIPSMMPYFILVALSVLAVLLSGSAKVEGLKPAFANLVSIAVLVLSVWAVEVANFNDYNFHAETRMYRAVEEARWDDVLLEAAKAPGDVTREMVILRNIALFNKGTAGSQMFHYNNMGEPPCVRDSLHVHMVQCAAPLIYLHHGKTNFSLRWCIENSVEYDYSFSNLKILSICSLIHGELQAARKYLDILSNTLFYKDWAEHYMPITENPRLIQGENLQKNYPELANIIELRSHMGSTLDGDNGLCEMYIINYFSNTMNKDSKYLQEITLDYAILQKDIQLFWSHFMLYATLNRDKEMPIHYQEAAYLYGKLEPQSMDISHMPFDKQRIVERYASFNQTSQSLIKTGMNTQQVGEAMKATFGDTFWWFYFFCRDVHSY